MLKNIAILCGGDSSEFEISIKTADQIIESLKNNKEFNFFKVVIRFDDWEVFYNNEKYKINKENFTFKINSEIIKFDLVLPFIHGTPAEDGKLQNYFDILSINYVSTSSFISALTFNKYYCNKLLSSFGLNIARSILITDLDNIDVDYISNYISSFDLLREKTGFLKQEINIIGNSQIDLYTGNISPFSIANQIIDFVKAQKADNESSWSYWLEQADTRYRTISISDDSTWILLPGKKKDRYVHIHPGRSSPHTVRVRSETLKCAIASLVFARHHDRNAEDPDLINLVRMDMRY